MQRSLEACFAERHRGFGFVRFEEVEDAEAAMDNMHCEGTPPPPEQAPPRTCTRRLSHTAQALSCTGVC